MRILRFSHLVLALVVCVLALGCSSGGGLDQGGQDQAAQHSSGTPESPGAPGGSPGQSGGAGAPGAPGNQGNGAQAIGAPIKIPKFEQRGAGNIDEVREQIEADIRDACTPNHDLCVKTVVEPRSSGDYADSHPTCFAGTKPDTSQKEENELDRDTELIIYHGSKDSADPCPRQDSSTESTADQQQSNTTTSTASTETTQQSSESTTSTETTQPETPSST